MKILYPDFVDSDIILVLNIDLNLINFNSKKVIIDLCKLNIRLIFPKRVASSFNIFVLPNQSFKMKQYLYFILKESNYV